MFGCRCRPERYRREDPWLVIHRDTATTDLFVIYQLCSNRVFCGVCFVVFGMMDVVVVGVCVGVCCVCGCC